MFWQFLSALDTIGVAVNLQLSSTALLSADVVKALNPQSPQARAIFDLAVVVGIVMAVRSQ